MRIIHKVTSKILSNVAAAVNHVYQRYMRKRIKNKDFTILCSNCIGGIIYNRLGLQFRSPTINLWMSQRDCIKLAADIEKYRSLQLKFIETHYAYPVAELDDITIYFNHSKEALSAANDWYRRMERVNVDNVFVIIYDCEGLTDQEIMQMENLPCKAYVVLSDTGRPGMNHVKKIKPSGKPNGKQFLDRRWHGLHTFERQFDFVRWLNQ